MKKAAAFVFSFVFFINIKSQAIKEMADSIRLAYGIPELAYAVVSSDSVFENETAGVQRINTDYPAKSLDRFHIGSNTKAITSVIAALLVQQRKISWNTKFMDLFPELKPNSNKAFQAITLQQLLTFRAKLPAYTYTFDKPGKEDIKGNENEQHYSLASYFLSQKAMKPVNGLTPSNADYILAELMLEKASAKSYKELVSDFGNLHHIDFGFGYPNVTDTLQPWGHDTALKPVSTFDNYKLNWLLAAGNINVSLTDYTRFAQFLLNALQGNENELDKNMANKLLFGLPRFSFGWFQMIDEKNGCHIAYNEGDAGAFITQVRIVKEEGKGFIIFTNAATEKTREGVNLLMNDLQTKYEK